MDAVGAVLAFWFEGHVRFRKRWFGRDPAFDEACRMKLLPFYDDAAAGRLDDLAATPKGALALAILLDQVPRNVFRGTARAFASDAVALRLARYAVGLGHDRMLHPIERIFLYLPFEHSECWADQERSIALFTALGDPLALDYAERHRDIVLRFGRYPHRNAALGRRPTPAEVEFLAQPGSSF